MNIKTLNDILLSQLTLHGNKLLVCKPSITEEQEFELFAGKRIVLCVLEEEEMKLEEQTLAWIADRIATLPNELAIKAFEQDIARVGYFQIGFESEGEFIEVINANEIEMIPLKEAAEA